jgi:hypothetical protein
MVSPLGSEVILAASPPCSLVRCSLGKVDTRHMAEDLQCDPRLPRDLNGLEEALAWCGQRIALALLRRADRESVAVTGAPG